jgi:putative transposase
MRAYAVHPVGAQRCFKPLTSLFGMGGAELMASRAPNMVNLALCAPAQVEAPEPCNLWLTAAELADMALPGLSRVKRSINERAEAEQWVLRKDAKGNPLARKRAARGGGVEYHISLLPSAARAALIKRNVVVREQPENLHGKGIWTWFEQQSATVKAEARERLGRVDEIDLLQSSGMTRSAAVSAICTQYGIGSSTVWGWLSAIKGIAPENRLPHLGSQRRGGGKLAPIDDEMLRIIASDYLRPEGPPTFTSCFNRYKEKYADPRGMIMPNSRTLFRRLIASIDPLVLIKKRHGREAHEKTLPPAIRTVSALHAMELVNIDGHKWDVFVRWPDGTIKRPMMIAIQDVYSSKLLAWRIDESENAVSTRLAFADLFRNYGIPKACLLDNGRAFASKWITGGAKTRFRFKIKPDDPTGLLPSLGINPHWALPYHGQSKPIERMFKDFCNSIATGPDFAGAYTGNSVDAKPENYGNAAVPLETFIKVITRDIALYNARLGRTGRACEMARGRSFDQVFNASYATAPIGKATAEQLRLALLTAADKVPTNKYSGAITVHGNVYHCDEMANYAGQRVRVRFDPDNLHSEIHVYTHDDRFIATVPVHQTSGFLDAGAAATIARRKADWRKKTKKAEEAMNLLDVSEVAALYRETETEVEGAPEATVIRPVRHRGQTAAALKPRAQEAQSAVSNSVLDRIERHLSVVK